MHTASAGIVSQIHASHSSRGIQQKAEINYSSTTRCSHGERTSSNVTPLALSICCMRDISVLIFRVLAIDVIHRTTFGAMVSYCSVCVRVLRGLPMLSVDRKAFSPELQAESLAGTTALVISTRDCA